MKIEEYTKALEHLLVYLCQIHEKQHEKIVLLVREGNRKLYSEVPKIQGSYHLTAITELSKIKIEEPEYSIDALIEMMDRRKNQERGDYIESLENLIIFMSGSYKDKREVVIKLRVELEFPSIQDENLNAKVIDVIAETEFKRPKYSFREIIEMGRIEHN